MMKHPKRTAAEKALDSLEREAVRVLRRYNTAWKKYGEDDPRTTKARQEWVEAAQSIATGTKR